MLKRLLNEVHFDLDIETRGPLLVRSGLATVSGPDMAPVRTHRNGGWEVFIPGSSLKGVVRSHSEKIVRTLKPGVACDPFVRVMDRRPGQGDFADASCGDKFERRKKDGLGNGGEKGERIGSETAYAESCPICRLFGSQSFIGRLAIGDAHLTQGGRTELRDGVGIDRLTGGASHGAKFELEAVSPGSVFRAPVHLRNFECWQLGLILGVLLDLEDGFIRLGGGRSRGFGAVTGRVVGLTVHQVGRRACDALEVPGLGRLLGDSSYGTKADDFLVLDETLVWEQRGFRQSAAVSGEIIASLRGKALERLASVLSNWDVPAAMRQSHFEALKGARR